MKVVIVGGGAVGFQLAKELIEERRDVVLIEKDGVVVQQLGNSLDCLVLHGEGTSLEMLQRAGVDRAEVFVAATDSDEVNMIACAVVASEFEVRLKIARVRNMDYSAARVAEKHFMGIDFLVNPEVEAAAAILRAIAHGAVSDVMLFQHADVQVRNLPVVHGSIFENQTLKRIAGLLPGPFLVAAIVRDNNYVVPSGDTVIEVGDILYVVGDPTILEEIFSRAGRAREELKKIVLVGGGRVGQQIASQLSSAGANGIVSKLVSFMNRGERRSIKIIDRNFQRCKFLADRFPNALVIHADVSTDTVLEEQHLSRSDLVIAVTDNQELNVLTALYAKSLGVRRAVALVNRAAYADVATQLGVDVAVSQKNALVATMMRHIRGGSVQSLHTISDGRIEVVEVQVAPRSRAVGRAIRELGMPTDTLIVALARENQTIVPGGNEVVRAQDQLVIVSHKEHSARAQALFQE